MALNNLFCFSRWTHNRETDRGPTLVISGKASQYLKKAVVTDVYEATNNQLYLFDPDDQLKSRINSFLDRPDLIQEAVKTMLIKLLNKFILENNELAKFYSNSKDLVLNGQSFVLKIDEPGLIRKNRTYCGPTASEVAIAYNENEAGAPIIGDSIAYPLHINREQGPQHINVLSDLYEPLSYPLIYLFGEKGWSHKMTLNNNKVRKSLFLQMYVRYNMMSRKNVFSRFLNCGKLL